MFIMPFCFLIKQLCKLIGLSFSFSSDGEDVILMKYLCRIKNGNYIDIGSHQPAQHFNTFLFYLSGWKGICIDPFSIDVGIGLVYKYFHGRVQYNE